MQTRTLEALATTLFGLGLAVGVAGFHPSVNSPTITRIGVVIALTSLPPWITVATRRAGQLSQDQVADAHLAGYQQALAHMEETAGDRPRGDASGCVPRPVRGGQTEKHGH